MLRTRFLRRNYWSNKEYGGLVIKKLLFCLCLVMITMTFSSCELLALPGQIIGGAFDLLGKALQVADSMPKPPPGVFF